MLNSMEITVPFQPYCIGCGRFCVNCMSNPRLYTRASGHRAIGSPAGHRIGTAARKRRTGRRKRHRGHRRMAAPSLTNAEPQPAPSSEQRNPASTSRRVDQCGGTPVDWASVARTPYGQPAQEGGTLDQTGLWQSAQQLRPSASSLAAPFALEPWNGGLPRLGDPETSCMAAPSSTYAGQEQPACFGENQCDGAQASWSWLVSTYDHPGNASGSSDSMGLSSVGHGLQPANQPSSPGQVEAWLADPFGLESRE